jgi:hypothetical protein
VPLRRPFRTLKSAVWAAVAVVVAQGLFGLHVATVLFYRTGAYFLDAGFYVYAVASGRAPRTPQLVAHAWGDSVFKTHTTISPVGIMAVLRAAVSIPYNFVLYLGLQHAAMAAAAGAVVGAATYLYTRHARHAVLAGTAGALLLPFSNIAIGSLAYPHVELLGASCITIACVLLVIRWGWLSKRWLSVVAGLLILVGVLAREDLGGQLAITVAAALVCGPFWKLRGAGLRRASSLLVTGAGSTILLLLFQRVAMGSKGSFQISYSGNPPYAHITSFWYLVERFLNLLAHRMDLAVAVVGFIGAGMIFKRRELFAFPIAVIPWILLNVTSVDPSKQVLGIYLMFPTIIYLAAPLLSWALYRDDRPEPDSRPSSSATMAPVGLSYFMAVAAFFLAGAAAPPVGGGYLYYSLLRQPFVTPGEIRHTNQIVREFAKEDMSIAVGDSVMSLNPVALEGIPLLSNVPDKLSVDVILFRPVYVLGEAHVRAFFQSWIDAGRHITVTCLPGGLVRADTNLVPRAKPQTVDGQFNRALRCHPRPGL